MVFIGVLQYILLFKIIYKLGFKKIPLDIIKKTILFRKLVGLLLKKSFTLLKFSSDLPTDFARTIEAKFKTKSRMVVSGLGKSGYISRKIAETLASTGALLSFVHATEGRHDNLKSEKRHLSI